LPPRAGVAGRAAGAGFADAIRPMFRPGLIAGVLAHAVGRTALHRLDRQAGPLPTVWQWLYNLCWIVIAALAVVWMLIDRDAAGLAGSDVSPTPSPSLAAAETASPTASTAPSISAAPTAAATAPDPYSVALEASRAMHAAIAAAHGKAGLNGREAKDLDGPLDRFDRAIDDRDGEKARDQAEKLADAVRELVEDKDLDQEAGARLQAAVSDLVATAAALPD